ATADTFAAASMRTRKPACSISSAARLRSQARAIRSLISLYESIASEQLLLQGQGGLAQLESSPPEVALFREQEQQIILLGHPRKNCLPRIGHEAQLWPLAAVALSGARGLHERAHLGRHRLDGNSLFRAERVDRDAVDAHEG